MEHEALGSVAGAVLGQRSGGDLGEVLRGAELRERVRAAGAAEVQVNVDDADVAPALRFGPGEQVTDRKSVV